MGSNGRTRRRRVAGRGDRGRAGVARAPGPDVLSVQLLPHFLAAGELPRAAVGDVIEVAPAVYAGIVVPTCEADRWDADELGTLEAVGTVLAARLDPHGCSCRVDVLDVGGRLLPLNPAEAGPAGDVDPADAGRTLRARVQGAAYLDPELAAGMPHGDAVALCRRRYRVRALRRYRRTEPVPTDAVALRAVPAPGEASAGSVYVADLVAVPPRA